MFLQILACVQHCMMLNGRSDDMLPFFPICLSYSLYCPVIGLGTAGRKVYFIAPCTKRVGNGFPCLCHSFLPRPAQRINTAGIPILFRKIRQHGIHHLCSRFRRRCIIQIYQRFHDLCHSFYFLVLYYEFSDYTIAPPDGSVNKCGHI